jgi:hypothetical protein
MADEPSKVSVADVVKVLAKHAGTPVDPDDAATLTQFNEQTAQESAAPTQAQSKGR